MKSIGNIHFGDSSVVIMETPGTKRTTTSPASEESITKYEKGKVARWGGDNLFPVEFLKQLRLNGAAVGGLRLLKAMHYGSGFVFHKMKKADDDGKREREVISLDELPEIKNFFRRNRMTSFFVSIISDLETFYMGTPEFILSKDRKKIVQTNRLKTAWCRKELIDKNKGYPERIFYSSRWDQYNAQDDTNTDKIWAVPTWWTADEIRAFCIKKRIWKFCMPINYPMLDEGYYNKPDWHAVYYNGWFEVSNSIPKYKKALFENQLNVKYIIRIHEMYFDKTYGDEWHNKSPEEKDEVRKNIIQEIDDHMSGNDAAGRSLYSSSYIGPDGKPVPGIEIEPIDNKIKDGSFLPDASAANSEILFSLGVDPSLIGHGVPGGKLGAGSGSDKREAFTILQATLKARRQTSLQIWTLLKEFNNWPDDVEGSFEDTVLTTLDKNPNGQEKTLT